MRRHVLSQHCSIGIGIVTADDHDRSQAMLLRHLCHDPELFLRLQLCASGADDIESAGIPVGIDVFVGKFQIIVFDQSGRTALEAQEHVVLIRRFNRVIQPADDIVAAGRLSAGKDHAHNLLFGCGSVAALDESNLFLTVGIGEERPDLLLIRYAFRRRTDLNGDLGDTSAEHSGQFGAVLISYLLQW